MGYDLERFVGYVNEGLLCCVCRDVLERPLQAPCEHAFCSSCISSWLVYHRSCPEDRLPLDVSSLKPLYRSVHLYLCVYLRVTFFWIASCKCVLSFLPLTGTCGMTWPGCRYAVWMQHRAVRWSAPWRTCMLMKMSASLPLCPVLTRVRKCSPFITICVIM